MTRGKRENGEVVGEKGPGPFRRLCAWIGSIPHLFQKMIVVGCLLGAVGFAFYAFRIVSRTGHSAASELVAILGVFTAELEFCRRLARDRKDKEK